MDIRSVIADIRQQLLSTFDELDTWFALPADLRAYKPLRGGWSINEILEHIALTNYYLLILIDKGAQKAEKNIHQLDLGKELANYQFEVDGMEDIGISGSFEWNRPDHMVPKGEKALHEIRAELNEQKSRCENYLLSLRNGEGVLYKTTMSVNKLGKIDVYQYIYFLILHVRRHIRQMEKVRTEFGNL